MAKIKVERLRMKLTRAGPERLRVTYPKVQLAERDFTEKPNFAALFGKRVLVKRKDWRIEVGRKTIAKLNLKAGQVVNVAYVKYPAAFESIGTDSDTGHTIYRDTETTQFVQVAEPPDDAPTEISRTPGLRVDFTGSLETDLEIIACVVPG